MKSVNIFVNHPQFSRWKRPDGGEESVEVIGFNPDRDEPTAALDSHTGRVVIEMLRDLAHEQERTVIIVTHDNRTLEFADRIIHIEDGKILE